ncbi:AFG1-like ATPase-domain-containing protein [Blyttiomyces helicus]|uniref:AFG1-like ATPase-domain-containing protein n=1 Tax=Blyttiomyces helicus TaxID=388810 RepID=A0A4P9WE13_9FUNG|nr:AFG1-like ATPase-domain-containing protein [Blyttiomyces helicus]|eukprot:RKO88606.1 AFG1-like ATPase-domain-containing protein [Blyttiomyces helicus]
MSHVGGVSSRYRSLINAGRVTFDAVQARLAARLDVILADVIRSPTSGGSVRGIYVYGPVGSGKSMIVDLLHDELRARQLSQRMHFHEFMLNVHRQMHLARQRDGYQGDPLPGIGRALVDGRPVLCLDEFQVTDIADAMILQRLFGVGVLPHAALVTTSNVPPKLLYRNGINRKHFLPFVGTLTAHCDVFAMDEDRPDYRRSASSSTTPLSFETLCEGIRPRLLELPVKGSGRTLSIWGVQLPDHRGLVVRASLADLCGSARGAADYLALCNAASFVLITDGTPLAPDNFDTAKRFITLVDVAYEAHTKLVVDGDVLAAFANRTGDEFDRMNGPERDMHVQRGGGSSSSMATTMIGGDIEWSATGRGNISLADGGAGVTDGVFAAARAQSRLAQMAGDQWVPGRRGLDADVDR